MSRVERVRGRRQPFTENIDKAQSFQRITDAPLRQEDATLGAAELLGIPVAYCGRRRSLKCARVSVRTKRILASLPTFLLSSSSLAGWRPRCLTRSTLVTSSRTA